MWTNEFEPDRTITTILDESAEVPDVIVTVDEHGYVSIEQYDSEVPTLSNLVVMPPDMFAEFLQALNSSEGAFRIVMKATTNEKT